MPIVVEIIPMDNGATSLKTTLVRNGPTTNLVFLNIQNTPTISEKGDFGM